MSNIQDWIAAIIAGLFGAGGLVGLIKLWQNRHSPIIGSYNTLAETIEGLSQRVRQLEEERIQDAENINRLESARLRDARLIDDLEAARQHDAQLIANLERQRVRDSDRITLLEDRERSCAARIAELETLIREYQDGFAKLFDQIRSLNHTPVWSPRGVIK